jgi:predicted nucleotide-binding protein
LFIGSAGEHLSAAYAIQENLERDAEVTVWDQDVFRSSGTTLGSLIQMLSQVDFAVLLYTPLDTAEIRDKPHSIVRDNVVFELGLFIGALGRDRVYFIIPREPGKDFHLPTDLLGVTPASYNANRQDENLKASLGPAANQIRKAMKFLGLRSRRRGGRGKWKGGKKGSGVLCLNPKRRCNSASILLPGGSPKSRKATRIPHLPKRLYLHLEQG